MNRQQVSLTFIDHHHQALVCYLLVVICVYSAPLTTRNQLWLANLTTLGRTIVAEAKGADFLGASAPHTRGPIRIQEVDLIWTVMGVPVSGDRTPGWSLDDAWMMLAMQRCMLVINRWVVRCEDGNKLHRCVAQRQLWSLQGPLRIPKVTRVLANS